MKDMLPSKYKKDEANKKNRFFGVPSSITRRQGTFREREGGMQRETKCKVVRSEFQKGESNLGSYEGATVADGRGGGSGTGGGGALPPASSAASAAARRAFRRALLPDPEGLEP